MTMMALIKMIGVMDIEIIIIFIKIKVEKKNQILNMIREKKKIIQEEKKELMISRWMTLVTHLEIKMMIFSMGDLQLY